VNILQAIHKVIEGYSVKSCLEKVYTYDMLQPKWFGSHYASFNSCGMTKDEYKGEWILV
jgi:hypothetical protein